MKNKLFERVKNNTFKLNESGSTYKTKIVVVDPQTDEEREVDVVVTYEYVPAERGSRERGTGVQLEPDQDAYVDISTIVDKYGVEYGDMITPGELDDLQKKILDSIGEGDYDF
jgi:hypothetical protein